MTADPPNTRHAVCIGQGQAFTRRSAFLLGNPDICTERLREVSFWNKIALRTGFVFDFAQKARETEL
jgi:hypothetical protein